jgi:hypothetical protein
MRATVVRTLHQQAANARGAHFAEGDLLRTGEQILESVTDVTLVTPWAGGQTEAELTQIKLAFIPIRWFF